MSSTKGWLIALLVAFLIPLPAVLISKLQKRNIFSIWSTRAFPSSAAQDWRLELLRWSLLLSLLIYQLSVCQLLLNFLKVVVRKRPACLAYVSAVRPFLLFIAVLGGLQLWGSLLIYQTTLNVSSIQLSLRGFLVTKHERILLMFTLFSSALLLVKYLMARINSDRFNRGMSKRVQLSAQHFILLAKLHKSANVIRERRKSRGASVSAPEASAEWDHEKAKKYLQEREAESMGKVIASAYIPRQETALKASHLGVSFPPSEANTVFGMLASKIEEAKPEEGFTPGDITAAVKAIFQEHQTIDQNLRASASLSKRLEVTLLTFAFLIAGLISLMVIHSDGYLFALQVIALITGFSYMTEDTIRRIFNCFMFAFVQHPFDIGDVIVIDKKKWTVTSVKLFSMMAVGEDGYMTDIPVSNIASKNISNLTRTALSNIK